MQRLWGDDLRALGLYGAVVAVCHGRTDSQSMQQKWLVLLTVVLALLCLTGCSSGERADPFVRGTGVLGDRCAKSEDCGSGYCVRLRPGAGICSARCKDDEGCPDASNWGCVSTQQEDLRVCACRQLATREVCSDGADNDCDGRADDCRDCSGAQVPKDDPLNCGGCGVVCLGGSECVSEACACPAHQPTKCGDECADTKTDPAHCGACATACGNGASCSAGECVCPKGQESCARVGCVDLRADAANCGECAQACASGQTCIDGECSCPDADRPDFCSDFGCVSLASDANHCGECSAQCELGTACVEGACSCPDEAFAFCEGLGCIDLKSNAQHCGACDSSCAATQVCRDGECQCEARSASYCDDVGCVDLRTDAKNCGECGVDCGLNETCVDGACGCAAPFERCDETCVSIASDRQHCGGCGQACAAGQVCQSGICACELFGLSVCSGECADLRTDTQNCGSCGKACAAGETCAAGQCTCASGRYCAARCMTQADLPNNCGECGRVCAEGQTCSGSSCRCSGAGLTACGDACVDLRTDEKNCGSCGKLCPATTECTAGVCSCPSTQSFCTDVCANLKTDAKHCGACGKACAADQVCSNGACTCESSNERFCQAAGECVPLLEDEANCGACGVTCPTSAHCQSGTCRCDQASQTLCSSTCVDLTVTKSHCGACGNACPGTATCTAGACRCPTPTVSAAVATALPSSMTIAAAWDGTHVGVAYLHWRADLNYELRFTLLNADGTAGPVKILGTTSAVGPPALIWSGTEYAVTWRVPNGTTEHEIHLMRVGPDGVAKSSETLLTRDNAGKTVSWPSLTYGAGSYTLAWGRVLRDTNRNQLVLQRTVKNPSTGYIVNPTIVDLDGSSATDIPTVLAQTSAGGYVVTTREGSVGAVHLFGSNGAFTQTAARISGVQAPPSTALGWALDLAVTGTNWLVTYPEAATGSLSMRYGTLDSSLPMIKATSAVPITESALTTQSGFLAVLTARSGNLAVQRFNLPQAGAAVVPPLHEPVNVLTDGSYTVPGNLAVVATGNQKLMAIWLDRRSNVDTVLNAVVISGACP